MKAKAAFHTLGCKLNFSETAAVAKQFEKSGFDVVDFNDNADVYILNTCTVTENAEKDCRQIVRRIFRKNPAAFVGVTGCYAQLRADEIAAIEGVDAVFGSNEKFKILSIIESFEKKNVSCIYVSPTEELDGFNSGYSTDAVGRTRAFFKIQDGCDYKCTFCTIPLARGKSRSQNPGDVIDRFKNLLAQGYKEIILTGVNVGDYGKNLDLNLYGLLRKILSVEGDYRIRISSIEPNLLTDDIIKLTADEERLCSHFHIPLQSGSPEVLRLMKRRYTADYYKELIFRVNEIVPYAGIGVDVIVGTPGETDQRFMQTYNFLKELPVSYLHVFSYSERPDTEAILLDGKVDITERKKRSHMLRILSAKKKNAFYRSMVGKNLSVLFEEENHSGVMKGFSSNYVRVSAEYNDALTNVYNDVKITGMDEDTCTAELNKPVINFKTQAG